MSKDKISDYSTTASNNTDIAGIGIQGTNAVSNFDGAFRTIMKQLADMNDGTSPIFDTFTLCDPVDTTKKVRIDAGSVGAGQTRVITMPNANVDLTGIWNDARYTSGSGWERFPSGLIIQQAFPVITLNAFGTGTATLPTAFTSSSSYVVLVGNGDAAFNYYYSNFTGGGFPSATQFAVQAFEQDGTGAPAGNVRISFIAIGT